MRVAAAALFAAATALAGPSVASATTYYVNASGSDANAGTSPAAGWRTVGKVNSAALAPGDAVFFAGGATFGDAVLMPRRSGAAGAPIVYGSYGSGKALLPRGVWMMSDSWLRIENLAIEGATTAISSSGSGTGVTDVTLANNAITNVSTAVLAPNRSDTRWTISGNTISHTGDSGVILQGSSFLVSGNTITDTGTNAAITYGKHGIYAKGPGMRLIGNTISGFQSNGISTRYQDALVEHNVISGGPIGIAYFQYGTAPGTTRVDYNEISDVRTAGVYLDASTLESFVLANNSIKLGTGVGIDTRTVRNLTLSNNLVTGRLTGPALSVYAPAGTYTERNNLWHADSGSPTFAWNGRWSSFARYRSASGQGAADLLSDPLLGANFTLGAGSAAVDAGTALVSTIFYVSGCGPSLFAYCGLAPDIGAVESRGSSSSPAPPGPPSPTGADTTPPSVAFQSPKNGALVGRSLVAVATAADTNGIRSVTFAVDGASRCTAAAAPYSCPLTLARGWRTITARATDGAGNSAVAQVRVKAVTATAIVVSAVRPGHATRAVTPRFRVVARARRLAPRRIVFRLDRRRRCVQRLRPYTCAFSATPGWHRLTVVAIMRHRRVVRVLHLRVLAG